MSGLRQRLGPERADLTELGFGAVLCVLGVIGFRTSFSGSEELLVGVPAVALGVAVGYLLAKLRPPFLVGLAGAVIVFVALAGPIGLRHRAVAGVLPSPSAVTGLAHGVTEGWKELLTTLPPAGEAGDLLAIPYLCGFAGAVTTVVLALTLSKRPWCVAPPAVLLAVSVLMGTRRPASLLLQGAVFAGATIAWASVRHRRSRTIIQTGTPVRQRVLAAGIVGLACVVGLSLGPQLPGSGANDRYVWRDEVEPPFDPLQEPSALAGYRNYTDEDQRDEPVVTVRNLPEGARLRIAVMDEHDGLVWRSTGDGSVLAGEYLRVGAKIPTEGRGTEHEIEVEVHRPHGVWVPLAGDVSSIDFLGRRGDALDRDVRVSVETDSAAVPGELRAGDTYRFTSAIAASPPRGDLLASELDARFSVSQVAAGLPTQFIERSSTLIGEAVTEVAQVEAMAQSLRTEGGYTDGGPDKTPSSPPGHSFRRLLQFLENPQPFGNGEQFGAALGLLAQSRGIPVRVVMGFVNESSDREVTFLAGDVDAWVEVPVEGAGWVPISATPPEEQEPEPLVETVSVESKPEPQPPPPTTIPPPTTLPEKLDAEDDDEDEEDDEDEDDDAAGSRMVVLAARAVGGAGILFAGPPMFVAAAKGARRSRRRRRGSPSERVANSFAELVDLARDAGRPVGDLSTRRELSVALGTPSAAGLAQRADAAVFGPIEPSDDEVAAAWSDFVVARRELLGGMGRWGRIRTAAGLSSVRRRRAPGEV